MATQKFQNTTRNMARFCRRIIRADLRWKIGDKAAALRRLFRFVWNRIAVCTARAAEYRRLSTGGDCCFTGMETGIAETTTSCAPGYESDSDLVSLKISILGDCQIGKTTFVIRYLGDDEENMSLQMKGLNLVDKTLHIRGARIAFRIWDVGGDRRSVDQVPIACKDAVAILFMFDLTSRCTLNSIIGWYSEARKWNQTAIPILIGTKFDDFAQLPPDIQRTVITQARAYAQVMKATLFFSSARHGINVNKIFKYIMAKLFDLPWTLHRNLTIGEPIIDF